MNCLLFLIPDTSSHSSHISPVPTVGVFYIAPADVVVEASEHPGEVHDVLLPLAKALVSVAQSDHDKLHYT